MKDANIKAEDFVHTFHESYRKSGIALAISLATLTASESWWLYGIGIERANACICLSIVWLASLMTGISVLVLSFYLQYRHYFGMRCQARWAYYRYAQLQGIDDAYGKKPETAAKEYHADAVKHFDKADSAIKQLAWAAAFNGIFAILILLFWRLQTGQTS